MTIMKKLIAVLLIATLLLSTIAVGISCASSVKYIKITGKANIRSNPDRKSNKIGTAKKGEVFAYDRTKKDSRGVKWYGIIYGSVGTAWISSKNAVKCNANGKTEAPKATPKPTLKPVNYNSYRDAGYYMTVTASSVNMRKEPASDRKVVSVYNAGDRVYVVRENGTWAEVLDEAANLKGYIYMKYLEKADAPAAEEGEVADNGETTIELENGLKLSYNHNTFKVDVDENNGLTALYQGEVLEGQLVGFDVTRMENVDAKEYMTTAAAAHNAKLEEDSCFNEDKKWYNFTEEIVENGVTSVHTVYCRNNTTGAWLVNVFAYVDEDDNRGEIISDELSDAINSLTFAD